LPFEVVRGLAVDLGVNYRGKSFGDPENTLRQPSYTLLDAGIRYAAGPWRIGLTGTNLANERYVSSCWSADYCARNEPRLWSLTSAYTW
jgi:iron complex outermembrane recepter protein